MYAADKQYSKRVSKWSDPDARPKMAIKTVLKGLLGTYGILSTEIVRAMANDNDNEQDEPKGNRTPEYHEAVIVQEEPTLELEKVEI
jgi:recombinational DNA repair protein RecT